MGASGSKAGGGSQSAPQTPMRETSSDEEKAASSANINKKGIAALIKPLRPPGLQIRPGQSLSEVNMLVCMSSAYLILQCLFISDELLIAYYSLR